MGAAKFFITRSDPMDPTSALDFYPPKGSDELHEALKHSYPHLKNLQSRMRQAVIDFYLAEHQEQTMFEDFTSPTVSDQPTPEYVSFNNMTPFTAPMSFPNTPALSEQTSPEHISYSLASLPADMPSLFPQISHSPQTTSSISSKSRSPATVPTQEELTTVWALPSKPDAKIHKRRCMTAAEKSAYKQKRLQGACEECRRRRRKCKHNTIISSSTPLSSHSATSSTASKQRASASKPPEISQPPINHGCNVNLSHYTPVHTDFSILGDFVADLNSSSWDGNADLLGEDMLADVFKPFELPTEAEPLFPFSDAYDCNYNFIDLTRAGEPISVLPDTVQSIFQSAPTMSRDPSSTESHSPLGISPTDYGASSSSSGSSPSSSPSGFTSFWQDSYLNTADQNFSTLPDSQSKSNEVLQEGVQDIPGVISQSSRTGVLQGVLHDVLHDVLPDVLRRPRGPDSFAGLKIAIPGSGMETPHTVLPKAHSCSSSSTSPHSGRFGLLSSASRSRSAILSTSTAISSGPSSPTSNSACSTCWLLVCSACHSLGGVLFGSAVLAALLVFMSSSLLSALVSCLFFTLSQGIMSPTFIDGADSLSLKTGMNNWNTFSRALSSLKRCVGSQNGSQSLSSNVIPLPLTRRLVAGRRISALSLTRRVNMALTVKA